MRSRDFNGNETSYDYDVFSRLARVVRPGDTAEYATTEYDCALAVPVESGGVVNYVETGALDKAPGSAGGVKRDHYCIPRFFMDELGRALMSKGEAEPAAGEVRRRVVVNGEVLFNTWASPSITLNPFFSAKAGEDLDALLEFEDLTAPAWNDPDRGVMTYAYDAASNLIENSDAKGQPTSYTYDGANRLRTEEYHGDGAAHSFGYRYNPAAPLTETNRPDVADIYDQPFSVLDLGVVPANTRGRLACVWVLSDEEHTSYDTRAWVSWAVKRVVDPVLSSTLHQPAAPRITCLVPDSLRQPPALALAGHPAGRRSGVHPFSVSVRSGFQFFRHS